MSDLGACPACGAGVGAHDAFCGGCGTPVAGAGGVPPVAATGPVPHRHIGPDAELSLSAGSPMRATDHLAAHVGMEAFRSGLTTLSSDSLFGAVEQVAVSIRARRGGLPVLDG